MTTALLFAALWLALSLPAAVVIGRGIRAADAHDEGTRRRPTNPRRWTDEPRTEPTRRHAA